MMKAFSKRNLRLMADYHSYPIWEDSEHGTSNVNPVDLPISSELRDDLNKWAKQYDDTLNQDDPLQSGFPTPEAEADFKNEGVTLLDKLKIELGEGYSLSIFV